MGEEIEAKIRVADPEAFRRRMAERGADGGETVLEDNRLFDDPAETLRRLGAALRVREERAAADGTPLRATVTYKGPRAEGELKRREEIEVEVRAAPGFAEATPGALGLGDIFEAIGLRETFRYEKRRSIWRVGECEVALDELPHLGWFVEIEGPTEKAIRACLEDLGLAGEPLVADDYIALLSERLRSLGRDPERAAFEI
ncbi:MAG: class IV adenylate cyclase [Phycisphaerae bacterium]